MASVFFSYSHKDEDLRNELEVHLAGLKRQGVISTWHDRRITAGTELGSAIDGNLNAADVILLLISPDFINSDYCYEKEMDRAMERHRNGAARVIPVILRPCDWHGLPFGKLLATPTDGKPVTKWPDRDEAFLNVVQAIKAALNELGKKPSQPTPVVKSETRPWDESVKESLGGPRSSNLRVRKEFTDLDRDRFLHEGFEFIAKFFENSMQELVARSSGLDQTFRRVDVNRFTSAIYQNGQKICRGSASIGDGLMGRDSIAYSMDDNPQHGSMNESVSVKNDDQSLYFQALGMQSGGGRDKQKLTAQGAAELFWELFIHPLQ
jgi:TIR domain